MTSFFLVTGQNISAIGMQIVNFSANCDVFFLTTHGAFSLRKQSRSASNFRCSGKQLVGSAVFTHCCHSKCFVHDRPVNIKCLESVLSV